MKRVGKIILCIIIFVYIILYISYRNGYTERINEEKKRLTEIKIQEYEADLKKGIDVSNKSYVVIEPSYDSVYTRTSLKISNYIEKTLDKSIKYLFHRLGKMVDE